MKLNTCLMLELVSNSYQHTVFMNLSLNSRVTWEKNVKRIERSETKFRDSVGRIWDYDDFISKSDIRYELVFPLRFSCSGKIF